jgi:hypothetical protein
MSRLAHILTRSVRTAVLASAASMLFAPTTRPARGADWPQWQGPDRNAVSKETGLLK